MGFNGINRRELLNAGINLSDDWHREILSIVRVNRIHPLGVELEDVLLGNGSQSVYQNFPILPAVGLEPLNRHAAVQPATNHRPPFVTGRFNGRNGGSARWHGSIMPKPVFVTSRKLKIGVRKIHDFTLTYCRRLFCGWITVEIR
jgi:hypothetical protein